MAKTWFDIIFKDETIRLTDKFPLFYIDEEETDRERTNSDTSIGTIDGVIPTLNIYAPFTKKATFIFQAVDSYDAKMALRELRGLLQNRRTFFIRYEREPGIKFAVNHVSIDYEKAKNSFANYKFVLSFNCYKGYSETLATTLTPFDHNEEVWAIGENVPLGVNTAYTHQTQNFVIYNGSSMVIDPRMHHTLDIALSCNGSPVVKNVTTGDVFQYKKQLNKSDLLLLSGVYPYKNKVHCGRDTNHGILTLAKGYNHIEVNGVSDIHIAFDFPFIYR